MTLSDTDLATIEAAAAVSDPETMIAPQTLRALMALDPQSPVVMVNLLRFRARAQYPEKGPDTDVSGAEAYGRYSVVAQKCIAALGGTILYGGRQELALIGPPDETAWHVVGIVRYPSRAAFLKMMADPEYQASWRHRQAGLEKTVMLQCSGP